MLFPSKVSNFSHLSRLVMFMLCSKIRNLKKSCDGNARIDYKGFDFGWQNNILNARVTSCARLLLFYTSKCPHVIYVMVSLVETNYFLKLSVGPLNTCQSVRVKGLSLSS